MTVSSINVGTTGNDGTGDPLRTAGQRVNSVIDIVNGTATADGFKADGTIISGQVSGLAQVGATAGSYARFTFDGKLGLDGGATSLIVTQADNPIFDSDTTADGIFCRTASGTYANRTLTGSTGIAVADGDGVAGDPTLSLDSALTTLVAAPLTAAELGELQNIGATTISATQWGYVGSSSTFGGSVMAATEITEAMLSAALATKVNNTAPSKFDATTTPTADWDSADTAAVGTVFAVGSVVIDTTADETWRCQDATVGAAVWSNTTVGTSDLGTMAVQNSNAVSITGGSISGITDLAVADGGTGVSTKAAFKTAFDLEIGTDLQAQSSLLDDIVALTPTDGNIIVGNDTTWVAESGDTALTSLGLSALGLATAKITGGTTGQYLQKSGASTAAWATPAGAGDTLKAANETVTGSWTFPGLSSTGAVLLNTVTNSWGAGSITMSPSAIYCVEVRDGGKSMWRPAGNGWGMDIQAVTNTLEIQSGGGGAIPAIFKHGGDVDIGKNLYAAGFVSAPAIIDLREVDPEYYGAVADAEWYTGAVDVTATSPSVTLLGGLTWPSDIVGKLVAVKNAGAAFTTSGGASDVTTWYGTCITRNSSTVITMDSNCPVTTSATDVAYYTDNTTAFTSSISALPAFGATLRLRGYGYHVPVLTFANKTALEILGRRTTLFRHGDAAAATDVGQDYGGNGDTATIHVQASCSEVGIEEITLAGMGATRDRLSGRNQQIGMRFDASDSELRSVNAWGNSNFGLFIGQDASNLTSNVTMHGGLSRNNVGDGLHIGHVDGVRVNGFHARANGDDNIGIVGYEAAAAPALNVVLNGVTVEGGDYRGLLIKHSEGVSIYDFDARDCEGAGIEVNAFRDDSGMQTGFLTHYSDEIRIKNASVTGCAKSSSSAGVGLYHFDSMEVQGLSVKDSGVAGVNECSNIVAFNFLNLSINGGKNHMSRGGGGQGIFYWNTTTFEGRDHRSIEATYNSPDAASIETLSINDIDFRMEVSVAGRYDVYILPDAGSAPGQDGKIDKIAAVTITGNRSGSYKGDQVGTAQCVIKINPDKVDYLDVGQTTVRDAAGTGTEIVGSNRNVFGHGIDLS
jgi:hypothetical protein